MHAMPVESLAQHLALTACYRNDDALAQLLFRAFADGRMEHLSRVRLLCPGLLAIARVGKSRPGTISLFVRDAAHATYGLSCARVLHDSTGRNPATVSQPPAHSRDTAIGAVRAWINGASSDAAIFGVDPSIAADPAPPYGSNAPISRVDCVRLGDKVSLLGARSGGTHGDVDGVGYYRLDGRSDLMMCFRIRKREGERTELSSGMDSGSIWHRLSDATGLGLDTGYAVVDGRRYAIASHLRCVLQGFGGTPLR